MKAGVDARTFAESLVATLPVGREGLYNPWREICLEDAASNGPEDKLARLAAHLDCEPTIILCAEAAAMPGRDTAV